MKSKKFKNWESLTNKMLDNSWKFRNLCEKSFDRGFIGELLVLKQLLDTYKSELCSVIDSSIAYTGGSKGGWDIVLKLNNKTIKINAKATTEISKSENKPKWVRQHAKTFCNIEVNRKDLRQCVSLRTDYDPNLFYVFVDVGTWLKTHKAHFFTLSDRKAKQIFGKKYSQGAKVYIRKNIKSDDFWVEYKDIKDFRDQHLRKFLE